MKLEKSDPQLETLVSRITAGELDLQPDFQRGEIWDRKRRQRLVDTILRDWYVPAVHIVVDKAGNELVLDGQQRLVAIRDFMADEIKVDGNIEPLDERVQALDGLKYSQLPPSVQKAVRRFVVPVITLSEYEPQEPNELFFRLNQAYNLTPPEKRNALHGEARNQVKDLVGELVESGLLRRERIGFTNGRLAYDDIIARVCVTIEKNSLRLHINNTVVEDFYRTTGFKSSTLDGVRSAGEVLLAQLETAGGGIKFNKGTLQTWLVYCFWAPPTLGDLPPTLLRTFEDQRSIVKRGDTPDVDEAGRRILELVSLYDDRASYRVTDVASVVARDLAVHAFSAHHFGTPTIRHAGELLAELAADADRSAQAVAFEYMERESWGDPLLAGDRP